MNNLSNEDVLFFTLISLVAIVMVVAVAQSIKSIRQQAMRNRQTEKNLNDIEANLAEMSTIDKRIDVHLAQIQENLAD